MGMALTTGMDRDDGNVGIHAPREFDYTDMYSG